MHFFFSIPYHIVSFIKPKTYQTALVFISKCFRFFRYFPDVTNTRARITKKYSERRYLLFSEEKEIIHHPKRSQTRLKNEERGRCTPRQNFHAPLGPISVPGTGPYEGHGEVVEEDTLVVVKVISTG
jgi:hypothetical protein